MKQKDITLIVMIAVISAVFSFVISHALVGGAQSRQQTAQVVPVISTSFPTPDTKYFNTTSIDPTQLIQIGNSNNTNVFNGSTQ
jgi:hypothetical protein